MARRLPPSLFCVILACAGLPAGARAAELGDARVVSHIGQPLVADIELTALHDDAAPVQVRLASADIYRGAGIAMPPALSGLSLSVARRGGRQFLHVTSPGPVQSDYLHLYLELVDGKERSVRLATLWLTPDPNPAPLAIARPVQPAAAPEPKPVSKAPPEPAPAEKPVPKLEPKPAPEPKSGSRPEPKPESKPAPASVAKSAAKPDPAPATAASAPHARQVGAPKPTAVLARVPVPAAKVAPPAGPAPLPLGAAKPGACARPDPAVLETCVALDYKNAQLTAQIGRLEGKVKVLQFAIGAAPAAATAPSLAPRPAKAAARVAPPVAKPTKAAPPEPALPWLWIALGGAVLLAGATVAVALRRKAAREREAAATKASLPPIMSGVKNRLKPDKEAAGGAGARADSEQE